LKCQKTKKEDTSSSDEEQKKKDSSDTSDSEEEVKEKKSKKKATEEVKPKESPDTNGSSKKKKKSKAVEPEKPKDPEPPKEETKSPKKEKKSKKEKVPDKVVVVEEPKKEVSDKEDEDSDSGHVIIQTETIEPSKLKTFDGFIEKKAAITHMWSRYYAAVKEGDFLIWKDVKSYKAEKKPTEVISLEGAAIFAVVEKKGSIMPSYFNIRTSKKDVLLRAISGEEKEKFVGALRNNIREAPNVDEKTTQRTLNRKPTARNSFIGIVKSQSGGSVTSSPETNKDETKPEETKKEESKKEDSEEKKEKKRKEI